jgi:Fe-S-cluster-containing dehydrogenase component
MNKQYGMVIDQERCIGCDACSVACKLENNSTDFWIKVETLTTAQKDIPSGQFPHLKMEWLPHLCNHCTNPPCVAACPNEALVKREDGIVIIYENLCNGCQACMNTCPYDIIIFNQERNVIEKCNFCSHRVDKGLEPFCVICCEGQAMNFGDINDPNSYVSKLIAEKETFQLKTEAHTGPSVYYCPPKPKQYL